MNHITRFPHFTGLAALVIALIYSPGHTPAAPSGATPQAPAASAPASKPAPAASSPSAPAPDTAMDQQAGELMRGWLAGRPAPAPSSPAVSHSVDPLDGWRAYLHALTIPETAAREKALRDLYSQTRSPMLRSVILRAITENLEFQGRQALFIRRYGFYANWFNRLVFSAGRLVQGQMQVLAQLAVDGVNDLVGPGEADPAARRAYDLLRRSQEQNGGRSAVKREELDKLERDVLRALASSDLDLAQYLLKSGDPEGAVFYATQAGTLRPDWKKAETVRLKAEAEAAKLRRDEIASTQVGYPDRNPPVELSSPELLRGILAGKKVKPETLPEQERLVASAMNSLPSPQAGQATMMRPWKEMLDRDPKPDTSGHRWLEGFVYDPQTNPDQRLAEARAKYRSNTWKYIFVGPEKPRERAYKAASWVATAWSAMQNVGIFYIFEVAGRTGQAIWSRPAPAEEVIDAEAAWLRQAPDPKNKEARKIAEDLYKAFMEQNRYDDARHVLQTAGLLDEGRRRKIAKAEAFWLLETARKMPAGPERQAVVKAIGSLDPGSAAARKADRIAEDEKKHAELRTLTLDWDAMARWTAQKPPCGLPGDQAWFDGKRPNGEALRDGPTLEHRDGAADVTVRYQVDFSGEPRVFQVTFPLKRLPGPVQQWFELSATQGADAAKAIKELNRLPIPFAVEGAAGPSGFDLYPKLLPLKGKEGEAELYK